MVTTSLLRVSELFYSLQGESTFAGIPCVFVRLADCNLRCSYCDAKYAYEDPSQSLSIQSIVDYVKSYQGTVVEVTGGEPLIQENTILLLETLLELGRKVLLETNGSLNLTEIPDDVVIIADVKCPGSGCGNTFLQSNYEELRDRGKRNPGSVEIKFVLSHQQDYFWAKEEVERHGLEKIGAIHFSPVTKIFSPDILADLILKDNLPVKLQLQLHAIIWPNSTRGV